MNTGWRSRESARAKVTPGVQQMSATRFFSHAVAGAALAVLCAGANGQPLPRASLNKASPTRAAAFGTTPIKHPTLVAGGTCAPDGLCLAVTLALADAGNPSLCGSSTDLQVNLGDPVNICYTVTNHSTTTLNYQTLSDDHAGQLLSNSNVVLAAGGSYQYNRAIIASTNPNADTGTFRSTWTATDVMPGYTYNDAAPYAFVDISASGTNLILSDDGAQSVTTPFPLSFYGNASSNLCIGNNGEMRLAPSDCSSSPYDNDNGGLPSTNLNGAGILPYWDDMLSGGTIYYSALGAAPNRQFVVQYTDMPVFGDGGDPTGQTGGTWEVIFNEADGTIDFEYQTTSFGGAGANYDNGVSATIGLQSNTSFANQYSYDTASVHDGLAIAWTPANPVTYSSTALATLDVGAPTMVTTPNAAVGFAPKAAAGSVTTAALLIDNIGNRDLTWSLTPPAPTAHFPKTPRAMVGSSHPLSPGISPPNRRVASKHKPSAPLGNGAVPVFATNPNINGSDFITFDAVDPSNIQTILPGSIAMFGMTFVNNDFSQVYGVEYYSGDLFVMSTVDGTASDLGNLGLTSCCNQFAGGVRWDATSGTTYLVIDDYTSNRGSTLYTVDLATAQTTLVGPLVGMIRDITFDRSGLMYGIDSDNDVLVAIDKTTGATQTVGSLGLDAVYGQGLDFDAQSGVMYYSNTSADEGTQLYSIDPLTAALTYVGDSVEVDSMAIAKPGVICSTPTDTPWLSYDVTSGTVTPDPDLDHPSAVTVSFDATGLTPGSYSANLCIYGNDPAQSRAALPVSFTVTQGGPADEIFVDGFDSSGGGTGGNSTILAQSTDTTPVAQNSIACGNNADGTTADNQYWRRYAFDEYGVTTAADVASADVSVEQTTGAPTMTVTLYTTPHAVTADTIDVSQLTQIGQTTVAAPANASLTSVNVPIIGTIADTVGSDLVVEVSTDDFSGEGMAFYVGSTTSPETHPSFLSSSACSLSDPTTTADIGFPNMHLIEGVNVTY